MSERRTGWRAPAALLLVAAALAAARALPGAEGYDRWLRLDDLPLPHLQELLVLPLGAVVVVFVRLTLGLSMLGPFRPILVAIGLRGAGLALGLATVVGISTGIVLLRPALTAGRLPYFVRLSTLLSCVVVLVVVLVLAAKATGTPTLFRAAYVPIVVLCLAADGFARVLGKSGKRVALWRGGVTLATAVAIHGLTLVPGLLVLLARHPELMLVEIACLLLLSRHGRLRLLEGLNPAEAD